MNLGNIIEVVSGRLGDRTGLDPKIILELEVVQVNFEKSGEDLPWFLLVDDEALTVPVVQSVALPTGFLRMAHVFKTTTEYKPVDREDLKPDSSAGCPIYAIQGDVLYLPDKDTKAVSLEITYYKAASILEAKTGTNGWSDNFPSLLIALVGRVVARFLRDIEATQMFSEDLKEALFAYRKEIVAREESGRERTHNRDA